MINVVAQFLFDDESPHERKCDQCGKIGTNWYYSCYHCVIYNKDFNFCHDCEQIHIKEHKIKGHEITGLI